MLVPDESKVLLCLYPLFCGDLIADIGCDVLYVVLVFKIRGEVKRYWSGGVLTVVGQNAGW